MWSKAQSYYISNLKWLKFKFFWVTFIKRSEFVQCLKSPRRRKLISARYSYIFLYWVHLTAKQFGCHICHTRLNVGNSSDIHFLLNKDNFDNLFSHQNVYDGFFFPPTSRNILQATMNIDPSFSLIDTFYNNRFTFFAVFSRVSRKAFAFTTNTDAVILTWIAVTLIGYN